MKRKLASLLIIIMALMLVITGCSKKETNDEKKKTIEYEDDGIALLWEVKSETSTIYLAGSIHVGLESMYPLKKVLLDAFADSDALAVEADIMAFESDMKAMTEVVSLMTYTDGTTIKDHISEETYELLEKYLNTIGISGIPKSYAYYYIPMVLASTISQQYYENNDYKAEYGVDLYFLNQAKEKEMPIIEIESVIEQYKIFAGLSDELQNLILKEALMSTEEIAIEYVGIMLEAWLNGNIDTFDAYLSLEGSLSMQGLTEEEKILYEEYNEKMLYRRNIVMADKVEELLKENQNVFYMVGVAHMFGEKGIVKILEERGYTVTPKVG